MAKDKGIFGVIAEFDGPDQLVEAAQRAYEEGYRQLDAYTPFPVHGLADAIGHRGVRLPRYVLIGGLVGGLGGFLLQAYANVYDYPMNIGGRPIDITNWPSMIPITFELGILLASFTAAIAMVVLNGLPRPYHPVFNVPNFSRATSDRFFLCIKADDPRFNYGETRAFLEGLGAKEVSDVES